MKGALPFPLLVIGALFLTACQPTVGLSPRIPPLAEVRVEAHPLVADDARRPLTPSAEEGRAVFERICAQCHGVEGRGDGPLAQFLKAPQKNPLNDTLRLLGLPPKEEDLPSRPANFHNLVQMRLNSPFANFETIRLGRAHTAMPAFGPRPAYGATDGIPGPGHLKDEEIWHVLFYEWAFATTPEIVALGRSIYQQRALPVEVAGLGRLRTTCAGCHGAAGDGRGGAFSQAMGRSLWGWNLGRGAGIFTDRDFMVKRKPTELFSRIADGHGLMPGYRPAGTPERQLLTDDEIWALVDYLWTFVYRYTPPRGQQP